ncbi:uncharacterized protein [Elaeis guineensis]|uniref:uncharacterized protein isoform X3 n=1 Tax=Elaeis guineensis var. tenera TaxID=51953 RepID=UPI003C6D00D7
MGNAFLNRTVDGFLKIGAVGASKVAAEETYDCLKKVKEDLQRRCILGNYSWGVCRNGVWSGKDAWYQRLGEFFNFPTSGVLCFFYLLYCSILSSTCYRMIRRFALADSHITHLLVKWRGTQLLFSHLLLPLSLGT